MYPPVIKRGNGFSFSTIYISFPMKTYENLHFLGGCSIAMFDFSRGYPLVNIQKTMERSTIFNGKIHYKWSFSIAILT
jgi:hypothetical protein